MVFLKLRNMKDYLLPETRNTDDVINKRTVSPAKVKGTVCVTSSNRNYNLFFIGMQIKAK